MEGLAKSAPTPETKAPVQDNRQPFSAGVTGLTWEDIPIDIFRQFSIDLGTVQPKEVGKIRDIYEWAKDKCEEKTLGNIMMKISTLENQLGAPHFNQERYDKLWNFIKLQKQIDDLGKRQDAMRKKWVI